MKSILYVINGVLVVAVIILFVLFFTSDKKAEQPTTLSFDTDSTLTLPIAYVDVDSLLSKYNYAIEISNLLVSKSESSKATISQKQRNLENEQREFQRKMQNNAFLTQERAEQEYKRIQNLAQDLENTAARLEQELAMEQMKYNNQLADSVRVCIKEYNKTANYQVIFSNSRMDNILLARDAYDITDQILNVLNSRYVKK